MNASQAVFDTWKQRALTAEAEWKRLHSKNAQLQRVVEAAKAMRESCSWTTINAVYATLASLNTPLNNPESSAPEKEDES